MPGDNTPMESPENAMFASIREGIDLLQSTSSVSKSHYMRKSMERFTTESDLWEINQVQRIYMY